MQMSFRQLTWFNIVTAVLCWRHTGHRSPLVTATELATAAAVAAVAVPVDEALADAAADAIVAVTDAAAAAEAVALWPEAVAAAEAAHLQDEPVYHLGQSISGSRSILVDETRSSAASVTRGMAASCN